MRTTPLSKDDQVARRKSARRTALWAGGVALLVYVGFIALGVLGR